MATCGKTVGDLVPDEDGQEMRNRNTSLECEKVKREKEERSKRKKQKAGRSKRQKLLKEDAASSGSAEPGESQQVLRHRTTAARHVSISQTCNTQPPSDSAPLKEERSAGDRTQSEVSYRKLTQSHAPIKTSNISEQSTNQKPCASTDQVHFETAEPITGVEPVVEHDWRKKFLELEKQLEQLQQDLNNFEGSLSRKEDGEKSHSLQDIENVASHSQATPSMKLVENASNMSSSSRIPSKDNTSHQLEGRKLNLEDSPCEAAASTSIKHQISSKSSDQTITSLNEPQQVPGFTVIMPSPLLLWDSTNADQQEIVGRSPRYKDLLKKKLPELTQFVQLPQMWPHLMALNVIDRLGKDRILLDVTEGDAVDRLVHYLERGPTWKLHGFLRALANTQQEQIIQLLCLNEIDYKDPPAPSQPPPSDNQFESGARSQTKALKPHYYKRIESDEMLQISNDLLPGLLQHCGSYNKTLMKSSLFGYKKNVPIDLTRIYICHDVLCKKNQREKMAVGKNELFQLLFGTRYPNCLSMEGAAGAGKSSYLENYAYEWSKDVTACEQNGPDAPCQGHLWQLIIYIPAGKIRGSAIDAIRENIKCEPRFQTQMMSTVENGEGVFVVYDSMDELHRKESIDSISSYIESSQSTMGKPKVLVSARDGLLSVDRRYFDRQLHLDDFSLSQGTEYIKKYFEEMHGIKEHPILQYVEAHPEELEWVLSNPLRVHILSELTACGDLTLEDLQTLTTIKLFKCLDDLLIERDRECRPTLSSQANNFYQVCLRCLLTDQRILSEQDVSTDSPYLSLLQRNTFRDQAFNDRCNFTFHHEMLFEYFSMRGLIECLMNSVEYKQGMLMYLCSEPKMSNVLELTCRYIAQYQPQLLPNVIFIIRACLILHTESVWCEDDELTKELLKLPDVIEDTFPRNVLTHGLTPEMTTKIDEISNKIVALFTTGDKQLRNIAWLLNGYEKYEVGDDGIGMNIFLSPFHQFLLDCLQQLPSEQWEDIYRQTFRQLLPCTRRNLVSIRGYSDITLIPVTGIAWGTVQEKHDDPDVHVGIMVWSPCDLMTVLHTWTPSEELLQKQRLKQCETIYTVGIDSSAHPESISLLDDMWAEDVWTPGLTELVSPQYCAEMISITTDVPSTFRPLGGLLSAFCKVIKPKHGLTGGLKIQCGRVTEQKLTEFCTWAEGVGLRLELECLTVVLSPDRGEEDVEDVDSAIRRLVEVDVGGKKGYVEDTNYITDLVDVLSDWYESDLSEGSDSESDNSEDRDYGIAILN